ncbi:MAG: hypothetical protein ABJD53_09680, partial [Gammaproteobacteria bacterium]
AAPMQAAPMQAAPMQAAPVEVIRDCAAKIPEEISGIQALDAACPGLERAIQALKLDGILYDGWRVQLNRDALHDVSILAGRYMDSKPKAGPDTAALPGILKSIAREQTPAPQSWWDAIKAWLNAWLQGHDPDSLSWLDRWLDRLRQSASLLNVVLYSLIGLVVIAAGWVVINELKAAGLIMGRRTRPARVISASSVAASDSLNSELGTLALPQRITVLLRLLVRRLMQSGRLKSERSLTHRELVTCSAFDSEAQRAVFAAVAASAEAILYGVHRDRLEGLNSVLREGEILLAQLPASASRR